MRPPPDRGNRLPGTAAVLAAAAALLVGSACSEDGVPLRPGPGDGGPPPDAWTAVAAGEGFTCAAAGDGRTFCWGSRRAGRLGDGGSGDVATRPVRVEADLRSDLRFDTVAAGPGHACGLTSGGEAYCWGRNDAGQLGAAAPGRCTTDDGTVACSTRAARAVAPLRFRALAVGGAHTCGITGSDRLLCWGANAAGQLGAGGFGPGGPEPRAVLPAVADVAAGDLHTCALSLAGDVLCWGANGDGQLGDRTFVPRPAPTVVTIRGGTGLTAGARHGCVLAPAHCWGRGGEGQIGDGEALTVPFPVRLASDREFVLLTAGRAHTCGVAAGGEGLCWGDGSAGALGVGGTPDARTAPTPVAGDRSWSSLSAGGGHTCGVDADAGLWCWGRNDSGQIGDGTREDRLSPTPVEEPRS